MYEEKLCLSRKKLVIEQVKKLCLNRGGKNKRFLTKTRLLHMEKICDIGKNNVIELKKVGDCLGEKVYE